MKPTFETGASTPEINDLILFTDNTRELAEERDSILKVVDPAARELFLHAFFRVARASYWREIDNKAKFTPEQIMDFVLIYRDRNNEVEPEPIRLYHLYVGNKYMTREKHVGTYSDIETATKAQDDLTQLLTDLVDPDYLAFVTVYLGSMTLDKTLNDLDDIVEMINDDNR